MMARVFRMGRDTAGTVAVEFGMIMPVLLLFLLGMVEYGQVIWTTQALESVGQQTARCVAIGSSACSTPTSYAVTMAGNFGVVGLTASNVQVVNTPAATTNQAACNPPGATTNVFTRITLTVPFTNPVGKLLPSIPTSIVTVSCYPITGS